MRHIIVKLLILVILGTNVAWAAGMDEWRGAPGAGNALASADPSAEQGFDHDTQKNVPGDHCCHATAYCAGLPQSPLSSFPNAGGVSEPVWLAAIYSLDEEPPLSPPNI